MTVSKNFKTIPLSRLVGRQDLNVKKITHWACRPMGGRPGYIFEIFENGHIFLKFYFFLNIKKKKPP